MHLSRGRGMKCLKLDWLWTCDIEVSNSGPHVDPNSYGSYKKDTREKTTPESIETAISAQFKSRVIWASCRTDLSNLEDQIAP